MKTLTLHTGKSRWTLTGLALLFILSAQAQDAFCVYRSDGEFNGFFYDQVVRMECSKVDYEGNTHDEYVMQEIETTDSLYRIPLASIDSIGFQQPEIKLNPRLRNMEEIGLHDYIKTMVSTWNDGKLEYQILLDKNLPASILPKVDDVLVDFNEEYVNWHMKSDSFGGKVFSVELFQNEYFVVKLSPLSELGDVFEQFISTEMITADENGQPVHRLAGWNSDTRRKAWGEYSGNPKLTLVDFDGTLERVFSPEDGVDITLASDVELGVKLQITYNISFKHLYVKTDFMTHAAATPSLSVQASKSFEGEIEVMKFLNKIKFPVNLPIFQTHPLPNLDVKSSGSAALKATFPKMGFDWNPSVTFDSNASPIMSFKTNQKEPEKKGEESPIDTGDLNFSLNGSLQVGIEFSANIETNDWIEKIFSSGVAVALMVGPKLEGSLSLSAKGLAEDGAYGLMKDSYVKVHPLSLDLSASGEMKFLWKDREKKTFYEKSKQFGSFEMFMFPEFKKSTIEYLKSSRQVDVTVRPRRRILLPSFINIGLYDYNDNLIEKYSHPLAMTFAVDSMDVNNKFDVKKLPAGQYKMKTSLSVVGIDVKAGEEWFTLPAFLRHANDGLDSLEVSGKGQKIREFLETNAEEKNISLSYKSLDYLNEKFVTATVSDVNVEDQSAWLNLDIQANDNSLVKRKSDIIIRAKDVTDTLRIIQKPLYENVIFACGGPTVRYKEITHQRYNPDNSRVITDDLSFPKDVPVTCSRSGNTLTISGYHKETDINGTSAFEEYTLNLVVDLKDRDKNGEWADVRGTMEHVTGNWHHKTTVRTTWEGSTKRLSYATEGDMSSWTTDVAHGQLNISFRNNDDSTKSTLTYSEVTVNEEVFDPDDEFQYEIQDVSAGEVYLRLAF